MGEILGVGITHYPLLLDSSESFNLTPRYVNSRFIPDEMKNPENWPDAMQEELADEKSLTIQHRERMIENFRALRQAIDDFNPDGIIILGDDQYENSKEDCVPPFCVHIRDQMESQPFLNTMIGTEGC